MLLAALGTAEVEAPGQLAQDQDVGAGADLRAQGRGSIERGVRRDRAQVGEQLEGRSKAEQGVLGPSRCRRVVPPGPPDGAEQHCVGPSAGIQGLLRQRLSRCVDGGAADQVLVPAQLESEPQPGGLDAASRDVADLGPDSVAGQVGDAVLPHGWLPAGVGTGSPPPRRWRAASTASAATGCSAISLFTAAR